MGGRWRVLAPLLPRCAVKGGELLAGEEVVAVAVAVAQRNTGS